MTNVGSVNIRYKSAGSKVNRSFEKSFRKTSFLNKIIFSTSKIEENLIFSYFLSFKKFFLIFSLKNLVWESPFSLLYVLNEDTLQNPKLF